MSDRDFLKDIECFRPFSLMAVHDMYGKALFVSIIRMLQKLGIKPGERLVYDPKLAKCRGLKISIRTNGLCYYGVSYDVYDESKDRQRFDGIEIDGKFYEIVNYWPEPVSWNPGAINCGTVQWPNVGNLEQIYTYLRMEVNASKKKRRYTIEKNNG